MEIERKFVADGVPEAIAQAAGRDLRQGYVAVDEQAEARVRADGDSHVLTIKGGHGLTRTEVELELDAGRFDALWALTEDRRVTKTRHRVDLADGLVAEVDVYSGALAGLVTAEVEFPDEAASAAFDPPAWLGREVTGDKRYANQRLAVDGRPA
ncbi:Inorganic triphosphatase [Paraconexibacter sp. AEG42_29]|uniref:Inorganic triphosphatase n=1 Tax=Paraconexibacter sp. AEG42_29 TaxID=2997339 RepID=A0AAU7ATQ3_9ACTN